MTGRLFTREERRTFPARTDSVQQRRDGDGFEPIVWGATPGHFPTQGRAFPRLDQPGGEFARIEIPANVTGDALAGMHTRGQRRVPAAENAGELAAHRFAGTTKLQRQV